jgi:hypothetical protein
MKSSFHSLIHFLPFLLHHLRLQSPELDQIPENNELKTTFVSLDHLGTDHAQNSLPIAEEACLLIRCLARGLYVTIYYIF